MAAPKQQEDEGDTLRPHLDLVVPFYCELQRSLKEGQGKLYAQRPIISSLLGKLYAQRPIYHNFIIICNMQGAHRAHGSPSQGSTEDF